MFLLLQTVFHNRTEEEQMNCSYTFSLELNIDNPELIVQIYTPFYKAKKKKPNHFFILQILNEAETDFVLF